MSKSYTQSETQTSDAPRVDLVAKLLRFALAPEANEGEAQNAAAKMVTVARRERVGFDLLAGSIGAIIKHEPDITIMPDPPEAQRPTAWDLSMPFGKYKGETLGRIALNDPRYLAWALENCDTLQWWLREAIESVLNHVAGREAA